ncbi:MAG: NGG1p interacting factor NIF3 [Lentisphaeria bacterium]
MYMLVFYTPVDYTERVKEVVFAAGGGRIGNYDSCCWQTTGQGQFRPLEGGNPFIGETGSVEKVQETRIEMVCADTCLEPVLKALVASHPYETPAYAYWPINPQGGS